MVRPRSGERSSSFSNECSRHFFKVFLPDQSSHQLKLPPASAKHFTGFLRRKSVLKSPSNKTWSVHLEQEDETVVLTKGWETFVKDNCLEYGDFLIFSYNGTSEMNVNVYSYNGCEKEDAMSERQQKDRTGNNHLLDLNASANESEADEPNPEESEEFHINSDCADRPGSGVSTSAQWNSTTETRKYKELICKKSATRRTTRKNLRKSALLTNRHTDSPAKARTLFGSKHAHFKVVMKTSYIESYLLNIPASFLKEHFQAIEEGQLNITLQMSNRSWTVNMITRETSTKLSKGWAAFARANSLRAGDVCYFELTNREDMTFEVSVSRSLD